MAELTLEQYNNQRGLMGGPIPGQSLTDDPTNPAPYEQAPQITDVREGTEYLWDIVTDEDIYPSLMESFKDGVTVLQVVQALLFSEFQKGTFNPDIYLALVEPLSYMLIALTERLDIDVIIDNDEDENITGVEVPEDKIEALKKSAKSGGLVPSGIITKEMSADMESLPSLLESSEEAPVPEPTAPTESQPSLMAPPEGNKE